MQANDGNQVFGSNYGAMNTGDHVRQRVTTPPPRPVTATPEAAELLAAIDTLRTALDDLLASGSRALSDADVEDAQNALDQAAAAVSGPDTDHGVLRRRINTARDALSKAAVLANDLVALRVAFHKFTGLA